MNKFKRYKALLKKQAEGTLTDDENQELGTLETDLENQPEDTKKKPVVTPDEEDQDGQEVVLDEEAQKAIVKQVAKEIEATVIDAAKKAAHAELADSEGVVKKNVNAGQSDAKVTPGASSIENMPKEVRFIRQIKALKDQNFGELKKFNQFAIDSQVKSNYMNTATSADGGYLVPPADFIADILSLAVTYGVARRNATVYEVNGDTVQRNYVAGHVTMTETNQAAEKTGTKMTFGQTEKALRKFAGIAPLTDELRDDAAASVYNAITNDFAREAARIEDVLMFTDATSGILWQTGVKTQTVGTAITDLDFDDLVSAAYKLNSAARRGAKFYFNDAMLPILMKLRDTTTGAYIATGPMGGQIDRIWGFPFEVVDVMPSVNTANDPFIVFGNLANSFLESKRGLDLTILTEATVDDAGGTPIYLAQQDMTALRAVIRRNVSHPTLADAYVVIGTGTVS